MNPAGLPEGYRLVAFDTIDSTSDEAKRLALAGAPHGTAVWARRQEKGRGRRGRGWSSPEGNLYLSVLLRPDVAPPIAGQLTFVAALALAEAIEALTGPVPGLGLKWPNDLLIDGCKIAGILLESQAVPERLDWIVIGIGVNLRHHPAEAERPSTALSEVLSVAPGAEAMRDALLPALDRRLRLWLAEGFAPVRAAWLERAVGLGQPVTVRLERETLPGRFAALDADGTLLLDQPDGTRRRIAAGDVFFPAPAPIGGP